MKSEILIPIFEKLNITKWRNAGYTGKGITVWNAETDSGHGANTRQMVLDVAPDTEILSAGASCITSHDELLKPPTVTNYKGSGVNYELNDFVDKFKPNIISVSIKSRTRSQGKTDYYVDVIKRTRLPIFCCAGNEGSEGEESLHPDIPHEASIIIGALWYTNGAFRKASYSSTGEELDFAQSVGWWSGTSAATPFQVGMVAMIFQRYGAMSNFEIYKYLKMISKDLGNNGIDTWYGNGQPILPELDRKYITMSTTSNQYCVDGNIKTMDTKPVNLNGNVFVPIRAISESLGADVKWEPTSRTVLINDIISLQIGNKEAFVGDKKVTLNYAPFIDKNNRTLVPIRFIAEALNCKVDWVQSESKVMILENTINR